MDFKREHLDELIFGGPMAQRFTQDSPVLPEVWLEFAQKGEAVDLLLTPFQSASATYVTPADLSRNLRDRLAKERSRAAAPGYPPYESRGLAPIAFNQSTVLARVWFDELVRVILPMSSWWAENVVQTRLIEELMDPEEKERTRFRELLVKALNDPGPTPRGTPSVDYLAADREQKVAMRELKAMVEKRQRTPKATAQKRRSAPKEVRLDEALWMLRVIGTISIVGRTTPRTTPSRTKGQGGDAASGSKEITESTPASPPEEEAASEGHPDSRDEIGDVVDAFVDLIKRQAPPAADAKPRPLIYMVSLNRRAVVSVNRSRVTVKADAAAMVFAPSCEKIAWAVIDSGIDATHPAFRLRKAPKEVKWPKPAADPEPALHHLYHDKAFDKDGQLLSRVTETYDFTQIQSLMSLEETGSEKGLPERYKAPLEAHRAHMARQKAEKGSSKEDGGIEEDDRLGVEDPLIALRRNLQSGRDVDWSLLIPFVRVDHVKEATNSKAAYRPPVHEHGTHVAGILGGDWGELVKGVCPDIRLIDLRVLDDQGQGDEFSVIAALQFIRYLRAHRDYATIQGVNLSLSIRHDVANYACGRTPVCDECERLVGNGMVVVAAAGNEGYQQYTTPKGPIEAYRNISITDPGNAESVITVGSTHRLQPHTYGVSYFSSRGPTGDGRSKPDLVAPGEKIEAPVPGDTEKTRRMDGTSMATPHVSGAAALLVAHHRELAGQPARIKQILCKTATDLGRERYFQGSGMVDILRALQSV
jgi:serine protease AprX